MTKKPMILGIGGSGAAMVEQLALLPGIGEYHLALVDTDRSAIEHSSATFLLSAAADWGIASGCGCGGDVIRGERALAAERQSVQKMLAEASCLTVCGGLGGGTATGGVRTISSVARTMNIPAAFLLTTPFSFEAYSRKQNADECIRELLPVVDILLTIPNDLLFSKLPPDLPAAQAFEKSALEMAYTVFGVSELMRCRNLLGADYAAFMRPVKGVRCDCSLGVGVADSSDGLDRSAIALERLLASPFLGGPDFLKKAETLFLVLSGGTDLQLAELKRTMEMASDVFPKKIEVFSGAAISENMDGRIQLTAIAVKYEKTPQTRKKTAVGRQELRQPDDGAVSTGELLQEEFSLTSYSRGIFENLPPTKYRDEDLDIPTFQRRNISIDRGKTGA